MRNLTAAIFVFALAGAARAADQTRVEALAGTVDIQSEPDKPWAAATVGAEIPEGGSIRTSGDGRAELLYPDGTRVWAKENTQLTIETQRSLLSRLSIAFGSLKARIPHLTRNRRMEFKTSTAVAAVRGTQITIDQGQDGKYDLNVLFGKVELRLAGIPKAVDVTQGHGFGVDEGGKAEGSRLLSRAEEIEGLKSWEPALSEDQRVKALVAQEENRAQINEFARGEEDRRNRLADIVGRQKEEDLAAGRTLFDVHGNLVRVDQRMMRPDASTIQFVNLVKRPSYNHESQGSWSHTYNGAQGITNRLDSMQMKLYFDAKLPEELTGWPAFFGDHEPAKQEFILANQTNPLDIFSIAYRGVRNQTTGDLDVGEMFVGRIQCGVTKDCLTDMSDFSAPGWAKYNDVAGSGSHVEFTTPEGQMIESFANKFTKVGGNGAAEATLWIAQENYVIDNGGGNRTADDFTNTSSDPFSILKETAFQSIIYAKTSAGATPAAADSVLAQNRNIDLVITPDVGLAFIQRIISDIDSVSQN